LRHANRSLAARLNDLLIRTTGAEAGHSNQGGHPPATSPSQYGAWARSSPTSWRRPVMRAMVRGGGAGRIRILIRPRQGPSLGTRSTAAAPPAPGSPPLRRLSARGPAAAAGHGPRDASRPQSGRCRAPRMAGAPVRGPRYSWVDHQRDREGAHEPTDGALGHRRDGSQVAGEQSIRSPLGTPVRFHRVAGDSPLPTIPCRPDHLRGDGNAEAGDIPLGVRYMRADGGDDVAATAPYPAPRACWRCRGSMAHQP
jgi:hypothetical protein